MGRKRAWKLSKEQLYGQLLLRFSVNLDRIEKYKIWIWVAFNIRQAFYFSFKGRPSNIRPPPPAPVEHSFFLNSQTALLHFFFNFFFQNHTRNYNSDLQPILNIKWPSRLNFASRKLTRTRLTIFLMFLQSIFFAIHIYNLQYNALPKNKRTFHMNKFVFSEDLPRWLGSFSLPWSLWAGKRRTLNSTKKPEDFGSLKFLSKTWILFGFGWVL